MLDKLLDDKELINMEVERIKLLFIKNNYDDEQKKWFIEAKKKSAKENNDEKLLYVCKILEECDNNA